MKLIFALLILLCSHTTISYAREITHEDIKDAMLSLVHMMRENTEKLERHEVRERQLGEQLKKTIAILTKRVTAIDSLKTELSKLDDRIAGIEQLIAQRDERERIQMQKTVDTLEDLENRLEGWLSDVEIKVNNIAKNQENASNDNTSELLNKLHDNDLVVQKQISKVEDDLKNTSEILKSATASQSDKMQKLASDVHDLGSKINDFSTLIDKINQAQVNVEEPRDQRYNMGPAIEEQTRTLQHVQEMMEATSNYIKELPRINEVNTLHNETQMLLQEAKHTLQDAVAQGVNGLQKKMIEGTEETKDNIGALRMDLANNADRVNQELNDLGKGQSVMVSMADHVLDTKKRVEYGVHQILLEVGDLVKAQGTNINQTLNQRFDGISNDIMDNQNGALANLTTKMEHEMNQVWRQINIMYQQMTESAKALDNLNKQNEAYVNGTTSTMDGMESKVGEITKRMSEVDTNLNYLLGRLSLVTQEFNQIKSGLGTALDNIKASFKEVQEKAYDLSNPGPHPVSQNYQDINEPEIKKPDVVTVK
ncbi:putative leucine-rich repeat-containing protein DDB_G0290503 isoform X2 [Prorops nasuta]|uniref:putative leucine-rich repeat-containing protein DDB_G0290503 isoform X2 n=1 Tax=Prorops nasuta TaxID=863751 RepID=UPI0034CDE8DF